MQNDDSQEPSVSLLQLEDAIERIRLDAENGLVLFVGAGISNAAPSNCPTWNELLGLVLDTVQKNFSGLGMYRDALGERVKTIKPELLCQILYGNLLEDFWGFLDLMQLGRPNLNHDCIARLAKNNSVPLILTTNFDTYIEEALHNLNISFGLHISSFPGRLLKPLKNRAHPREETQVVKIHGSLDERTSIVLTLRQAGLKLRPDLSQLIAAALDSYTILIVGYSGNDDDIFPVLLDQASKAKRVYWILWGNEESLTPNIGIFAKYCPNCLLVGGDKQDVFVQLVDGRKVALSKASEQKYLQIEFLLRWIATTRESCWQNFFFELLFFVDCVDKELAQHILRDTSALLGTEKDPWAVTRALVNRAHALILLQDYPDAIKAFSRAADNYMNWGHHREVIECLTAMVTKIPQEAEWRGNTPLFWAANLSGKSYNPYELGLYNHAAGKVFVREHRLGLAMEHFLTAGGYAKESGDQVTLLHSLDEMGTLFIQLGDRESADECLREAGRIKQLLGVQRSPALIPEGAIIKKSEEAARRNFRKLIMGEAALVFGSAVVFGGIASFFLPTMVSKVVTFLAIFLGGAGLKIWNARKRFFVYSSIDRS